MSEPLADNGAEIRRRLREIQAEEGRLPKCESGHDFSDTDSNGQIICRACGRYPDYGM